MSLAQLRLSLFLYYSQISMNDPAHKQKLLNVDNTNLSPTHTR